MASVLLDPLSHSPFFLALLWTSFRIYPKEKVAEASRRIVEESIAKGKKAKKDMSVLEKFIDRNGADSPIPSIMASDMLFAGIETTGMNRVEIL